MNEQYGALNRVLSETQGSNGSRTYKYDAVGNLREKTDRNGRLTKFEYDDSYRMTHEKWYQAGMEIRDLAFTYDLSGQMRTASDSAATYSYEHDLFGRITQITHDLPSTVFDPQIVMSQTFDLNDNRLQLGTTIAGTSDFVTDYQFDKLNRLTQVTQHGVAGGNALANKRVDLSYDAADQLKAIGRFQDLAGISVREQCAGLYSRVASQNPAGFAQSAFNEARANFLLGRGPNPGPSVVEFAKRHGIPISKKQ